VAQGIVNRIVPRSAFALGVVRSFVHGVFLFWTIFTSYSALGSLPATILRPTGVMKLLPWSLFDQLQTPAGILTLKTAMVLSLLLSTLGLFTAVSTKTSLLLVLFYQGLLRSFGHFNHDEMIAIYFLAVLAFTPCGDEFSIDNWLRKMRKVRPWFAYAYPILLMQLLLAWVYVSSALIKIRVAGWKYLSPDNLPSLAIFHSLDNLHDTHFQMAFSLPQVRSYLPLAVGFVLIWEVLFPLAIFCRRIRWWILGIGIIFHFVTLFLMNIFFPHQLAMYVVFVDWDQSKTVLTRRRNDAGVDRRMERRHGGSVNFRMRSVQNPEAKDDKANNKESDRNL
jgi:hypothetical protein